MSHPTEEYPPLTPLSEYPLHGWDYGEPYACQRPEDDRHGKPVDWRCVFCLLAAQAELINNGDSEVLWRKSGESEEHVVKLSWLIARSEHWLLYGT